MRHLSILVILLIIAALPLSVRAQEASPGAKAKPTFGRLAVTPKARDFGAINFAKTPTRVYPLRSFTVSNTGTDETNSLVVMVGPVSGAGSANFKLTGPTSPVSLMPKNSAVYMVNCVPIADGRSVAEIAITAVSAGTIKGKSSQSVNLACTAKGPLPPTATATQTPTPTPTSTATATATATAAPTPTPAATPSPSGGPSLSGTVESGFAAISGATVTLYEAGTDYGLGATVLGSASPDSNGNFTIGYSPLAKPAVLYLVAVGGNAGAGSNSAIGLTSIAGVSNALPASVTINELTTVATEWALAQFADASGQVIGAPTSNGIGFANAISQAQTNLANVSTGAPADFWNDQGASLATCTISLSPLNCDGLERMDTFANILASCVESPGPSSGPCATLLSDTAGSVTTLAAAHAMATNPVANVAALFALQTAASPFAPALSAVPDGWELVLYFLPAGTNFAGPIAVAIDATGNAWFANGKGNGVIELTTVGATAGNFNESAQTVVSQNIPVNPVGGNVPPVVAIDAAGNVWITNALGNSVTELTSAGAVIGTYAPSGADFNAPLAVAIDAGGNVWITNAVGNSVTELTSSGALVSNYAPLGADFNGPNALAIDTTGNIWVTNLEGNTVTELTSGGALAGNYAPLGANFNGANGLAIDLTGNVWVTNLNNKTVTELTSAGALDTNFVSSGYKFNGPNNLAIDAAGNLWIANLDGSSVTEMTSGGAPVAYLAPSATNFFFPNSVAIDASGNVWVTNPFQVTLFVGAARPVLTPMVACLQRSTPQTVCLP